MSHDDDTAAARAAELLVRLVHDRSTHQVNSQAGIDTDEQRFIDSHLTTAAPPAEAAAPAVIDDATSASRNAQLSRPRRARPAWRDVSPPPQRDDADTGARNGGGVGGSSSSAIASYVEGQQRQRLAMDDHALLQAVMDARARMGLAAASGAQPTAPRYTVSMPQAAEHSSPGTDQAPSPPRHTRVQQYTQETLSAFGGSLGDVLAGPRQPRAAVADDAPFTATRQPPPLARRTDRQHDDLTEAFGGGLGDILVSRSRPSSLAIQHDAQAEIVRRVSAASWVGWGWRRKSSWRPLAARGWVCAQQARDEAARRWALQRATTAASTV